MGPVKTGLIYSPYKIKYMIKLMIELMDYVRCRVCGRDCRNVGSGAPIKGMCERCYENGGDDE